MNSLQTRYLPKHIFIIVILFATFQSIAAQQLNVEYYQLTKTYYSDGSSKVENGKTGQFITRTKQICYDSDKDGYSVRNGTLRLINKVDTDSKYLGSCYYGDECTYTFYDAKGILNIADSKGRVYVYKKTNAPQGKNTSSLIVRHNESGGGMYTGNESVSSSSSPSRSSSGTNSGRTSRPKRCSKCSGRGICTVCLGKGTYQPNPAKSNIVRCSTCGGGGRCSLCGGSGTYGTYR